MLLEAIRDFDWLNEPNFRLGTDNFIVIPDKKTDFWQDVRHGISRDNGHFFYTEYNRDFNITVKWKIDDLQPVGAQCGLMGRVDEYNWCKISLIRNPDHSWSVATSVTCNGTSDLSLVPLPVISDQMSYRLESYQDEFCLSYSLNGKDFVRIRLFQLPIYAGEITAGAYICNPSIDDFSAPLLEIVR